MTIENKLRKSMSADENQNLDAFIKHIETKHLIPLANFRKNNPDKKQDREYNPYGVTPAPATYEITETSVGTVFKGKCNYPKCGFVLDMTDYQSW